MFDKDGNPIEETGPTLFEQFSDGAKSYGKDVFKAVTVGGGALVAYKVGEKAIGAVTSRIGSKSTEDAAANFCGGGIVESLF